MAQEMNPEQIEVDGKTLSLKDYVQEHEELANENATLKAQNKKAIRRYRREEELKPYQAELIKMQQYLEQHRRRMIILFEGRDAAGKGGTIKRILEPCNPRIVRVVALGVPTEREKTQWYFQRYVPHLPAAGEMVLFDRSWYNRAGVERVMGFCTEDEYREFMRSCPEFERMLVRSGIILIKYWFSVSDEEQERRFQARIDDPRKVWKLSPMDVESFKRWYDYSRARDDMLAATHTGRSGPQARRIASACSLSPMAGDSSQPCVAWLNTEKRYWRPILNTLLTSFAAWAMASILFRPRGIPACDSEAAGLAAESVLDSPTWMRWSRVSPAGASSRDSMFGTRETI